MKYFVLISTFLVALAASVVGKKVYLDRAYCLQTRSALIELHNLNNKIRLNSFVNSEQSSGLKELQESHAVFLTRSRDAKEMHDDLVESLQKLGLSLERLELDSNSTIPDLSDKSPWLGELSPVAPYEPKEEQTFQIQKWTARITGKEKNLDSVKAWIEYNKKNGTVALLVDDIRQQGRIITLHFSTGMIPAMKLPRRVFNLEKFQLVTQEPVKSNFNSPDILSYQACATKTSALFEKLKNSIQMSSLKMQEDLERADRMKWLWLASKQAKAFIAKTQM